MTLQCQFHTLLQLSPIVTGRIDTRIRRVNCSPPAGMAINVMDGRTGSGFFKFTLQVRRRATVAMCCCTLTCSRSSGDARQH